MHWILLIGVYMGFMKEVLSQQRCYQLSWLDYNQSCYQWLRDVGQFLFCQR